jgi:hypothetical protein
MINNQIINIFYFYPYFQLMLTSEMIFEFSHYIKSGAIFKCTDLTHQPLRRLYSSEFDTTLNFEL